MYRKCLFLQVAIIIISTAISRAQVSPLQYQLLPDSTITPVATGISQPLSGGFTWLLVTPSDLVDANEFDTTFLSFVSASYSITLTNSSQYSSSTQTGPDGDTSLNALVSVIGDSQSSDFIGGYGDGTFTGSSTAPFQLAMTEGMGASSGGAWTAHLYIHAQLAPFFTGEAALGTNWYYLAPSSDHVFGFYSLAFFPCVYHNDLGFEYYVDANNASGGAYFYDFASSAWFYTEPNLFPYLYDFSRNAWLYYAPDPNNPGFYTSNPRWFYDFSASLWTTNMAAP